MISKEFPTFRKCQNYLVAKVRIILASEQSV